MPSFRQDSTTVSLDSAYRNTRRTASSLCPRFAIIRHSSRPSREPSQTKILNVKMPSFLGLAQVLICDNSRITGQ